MAVVLPHRKAIVIPKPEPKHFDVLRGIFPFKSLPLPDGEVVALPHCRDSLQMLENMGVNVEGCELMEHYYDPPVSKDGHQMWWWQVETAVFLTKHYRGFCTSTPRTGKTLSTLAAIDFLQQQGEGAAIVVAPLTVASEGEWTNTLEDWFPHKKVVFVHKDREAELNKMADVYLINPDGFKTAGPSGLSIAEIVAKLVSDKIVTIGAIDELTEFANCKSQKWAAANQALSGLKYLWGLTGTPGPPDKIYAQVKLINPANVPDWFGKWRDMTEEKITQFKWRPAQGHEEVIAKAMSPCIRFDKDQLMKIPVPEVVRAKAKLSPQQQALTDTLVAELEAAVLDENISASTESVLAMKLLQVSNGVVRGVEGVVRVDCTPKLELLEHWLRHTDRKKVVFSNFTAVNDMLVEEIKNMGFSVVKVDGTVSGGKRGKIFSDFANSDDPHVLVCHPKTTAYGVELARADTLICFGPPMSGAFIYQQMAERVSSSKQTAEKTYLVHLGAGQQDWASFDNLGRGVNLQKNIVDIFTKNLF